MDTTETEMPIRPLLLRFATQLRSLAVPMTYDAALQVNVISGTDTPAVRAGLDVKTQTVLPGED